MHSSVYRFRTVIQPKYKRYCIHLLVYITIVECSKRLQNIECYEDESLKEGTQDISDDKISTPNESSIFFHETSCRSWPNEMVLDPLYACAVESAAKLHPHRTVYLLFNSPITYYEAVYYHGSVTSALLKYSNIKIRRLKLIEYVKGTSLEEWYRQRWLQKSHFPVVHASDVLRFVTMWKYGGTYVDLDYILLKSLDDLGSDFLGLSDANDTNTGVLNFSKRNVGAKIAEECLREINTNFRLDTRECNGPKLIQRVLRRICNVTSVAAMTPEACQGFKVLNSRVFYPIAWTQGDRLYEPSQLKQALTDVKDSYGLHVWRSSDRSRLIDPSENSMALGVIAKMHCPNVFKESGNMFY